MSKTIINLTLSAVVGEIEDVLETYPYHPYRQLFLIPDLRQELIAYVLSRVANRYVAVEEEQKSSFKSLHLLTEETLHIKVLIHKGIEKILYKKEEQISQRIPGVIEPSFAPSNWFG
ncbi:MAG: hypothetical protein SAK29_00085 [Scytonema sp. PMC 1069.18]|nr:hypothetical protein [Scytonema sp. PMC 1069.18]MEC4879976.1 hypothetical protein [Scytonema sp. PMC 1070.18]